MGSKYTKEDCINSLQEAYTILGKSPSSAEYRELGLKPTSPIILDRFGSWNNAKKEADLSVYTDNKIGEPPEIVDISQEEWNDMSKEGRSYWRKKAKWAKKKLERGCSECGYDKHPTALEWHHKNPENKTKNVSWLIKDRYGNERIQEEVDKCIVLCANCHAEFNGLKYDLDENS